MTSRPSTRVGIDQPFAQSVSDQFGSVVRSGLAHHAGTMAIDRFGANSECLADLPIGSTCNDLTEHLPFAVSQRFQIRTFLKQSSKAATHDPATFYDARDGADDLAHVVGFAEYAVRADIDQLGKLTPSFDTGEDDYTCFGRPTAGFKQYLGSARVRHRDVKHQQPRPVLSNSNNRINPVIDSLNDLDPLTLQRVFIAERGCERVADNRMIIRDDRSANRSKSPDTPQLASSPKPFAFWCAQRIRLAMGRKRVLNRVREAVSALLLLGLALLAPPALADTSPSVAVEPGRSHEMVESSALFLVSDAGREIGFGDALTAYRSQEFSNDLASVNTGEFHDWRVWIALPFHSVAPQGSVSMRRVIGIGGIFVRPPRVHLACEGEPPREILASRTQDGGPLSARYFTYVRSQSFTIAPGQECLALINTASSDNPNIGIFREGELGTRQVIAVLLKGGFTATLLIIGVILAVVSYLTSRPLGVLIGITYSLTMLQNEASLFTTTLVPDPLAARERWENITLLTIFAMLNVFLFGFRTLMRLENWALRIGLSVLLMIPLIAIARSSNATPDIIWAFYLALLLFAVTVAFRFDIARPLRLMAGAILITSAICAILVEPYYLGRELSDLTIEWFRDAFRLFAGLGMLGLLLVDVLQTRRERTRLFAERIEALETQAESDRRLLETEREYARAREAASRTKAQLAAASHDIRQPIVGLRAAVGSEAERLSPGLQSRLGQAIDYLEHLTREYSDREGQVQSISSEQEEEPYSLDLITNAVSNMFDSEARQAGVRLTVSGSDCQTSVPALALIRAASNLVANALRHADPHLIEITAVKEQGRCEIRVSDDGQGMDAATLAKVQAAGTKSDTSDGDGLGLAIVHDLASRHGFTFTLSSSLGSGTDAVITLPECSG